MNSRHLIAVACGLFALLHCSQNPVDINDGDIPIGLATYQEYGLTELLAGDSGLYWATNGYNLYRLEQASADVWQVEPRSLSPTPYSVSLFRDSLGRPSYLSRNAIGHISDTTLSSPLVSLFASSTYWQRVFHVDANGVLYHVLGTGRAFTVFRWNGLTYMPVFSDTLHDVAYPESLTVEFASNDTLSVLGYSTNNRVLRVRVYRDGVRDSSRDYAITGSRKDTVCISGVAVIDGSPVVLYERMGWHNRWIVRWRSNEWRVPEFVEFEQYWRSEAMTVLQRSESECWIRNAFGYLVLTAGTEEWTEFRSGSINRFDVFCFDRAGTAVFFDEATRTFITQP